MKQPPAFLEAPPVGLALVGPQVVVATMDSRLHWYLKGKRAWSMIMPAAVADICTMQVERAQTPPLALVGLSSGEVRVYRGRELLNTFSVGDPVRALRFGRFSREDNSLAVLTKSGSVVVKMLARSANLQAAASPPGPPPEQSVPLAVPRQSQLGLDQATREREQAPDMHRAFQQDLSKLRLRAAQAYAELLGDGSGPSRGGGSGAAAEGVRLTAHVSGLGPFFILELSVQNSGASSLSGVAVALTFDHDQYRVPRPHFSIPLLLPGVLHRFKVEMECLEENAPPGAIRILALNPASPVPFVSALVAMPQSEVLD